MMDKQEDFMNKAYRAYDDEQFRAERALKGYVQNRTLEALNVGRKTLAEYFECEVGDLSGDMSVILDDESNDFAVIYQLGKWYLSIPFSDRFRSLYFCITDGIDRWSNRRIYISANYPVYKAPDSILWGDMECTNYVAKDTGYEKNLITIGKLLKEAEVWRENEDKKHAQALRRLYALRLASASTSNQKKQGVIDRILSWLIGE